MRDAAAAAIADDVAEAYEKREFGAALRLVMGLADRVNEYFDARKPWELAKRNRPGTPSCIASAAIASPRSSA